MADLVLNWTSLGTGPGTPITDPVGIETGGVEVAVNFFQQDPGAEVFTVREDLYEADGEPFQDNSGLKLFGDGSDTGTLHDTLTLTMDFTSSDPVFGDEVTNVSFRINDIDSGDLSDIPGNGDGPHQDVVAVRAFDAAGNPVPVTLTPGGGITLSGNTMTGEGENLDPTDADASALVEIAGPVARIEIDYDNALPDEQRVILSDVHFSTTDGGTPPPPPPPGGLDGIVEGTPGDDLIDVNYTGDPQGDRIDAGDNIDPTGGPDDDNVQPGDGNDTVIAGEGSDTVAGGLGDDDISTGNSAGGGLGIIDEEIFPGTPVDPDPEDDRDLVEGARGNDTISTGDDRDTVFGGPGDDVIDAGIDNDIVDGGAGNDSITDPQGADLIRGGDGDDTINAGIDTFSDYVGDDPNLPLPGFPGILSDPNVMDGRDTVDGGEGNDIISTGDDADLITGGAGRDTIDGGIDDDTIDGGSGDDSIIGGHGSDSILGGDGNDFIDASAATSGMLFPNEPDATDPVPDNDRDFVDGGAGNDTIMTGDDDDTILGGLGADVIDAGIDDDLVEGGAGDDSIDGGEGNDTITGGEGNDTLFGNDGRDVFLGGNPGDVVDGGDGPVDDGPDDFDTLDLTGAGDAVNPGGTLRVIYDPADPQNGTVEFIDSAGDVTGTMSFVEIENVIPCFTPGTVIATPQGERLVEDLRPGDRVITRDNGIQEIAWIGSKTLTGH